MRLLVLTLLAAALLGMAGPARAQKVVIPNTSPAAVLERLKGHLLPQGFKLEHGDAKQALFTLDRGMVAQNVSPARGAMVHVILELHVRFKEVKAGLQVTAREEVVGDAGTSIEFRKPVGSRAELTSLQRLLDQIHTDLGASATSPRDST